MGIRGSRRRRKMTKQQDRKIDQPVTSVDDLSDDLLGLVLLGLDWSVSLTRAAATCRRWRRIVAGADGAFLRRFRSLHHAPPPVGHFYYAVNADPPCSFGLSHTFPHEDPVFVPSSGSPVRQPMSLDFMPSAGDRKRQVIDSRGSLLLVLYDEVCLREYAGAWRRRYNYGDPTAAPELVVCEPLTRRYEKIVLPWHCGCVMSAFLLDGDADDEAGGTIGMDTFRVLLVLYDPDRDDDDHDMDVVESDGWYLYRSGWPYTAVFSRGGDGGIECAVDEYDMLDSVCLPNIEEVHLAGRTGGRAYWGCDDGQVVVLDERTFKLSAMAFPDHMTWGFHASNFRVVGVDGYTVRIVCITNSGDLEVRSYTFHSDASDESYGDKEWVVEKRVELAEASLLLPGRKEEYFRCLPEIIAATEEFVVLSPAEETWLFSVDLGTMELEREHDRNRYKGVTYPCAPPWPPVMRACVGD
ncbi:unnamed protein product [Urochloa decumbens]|uniref:F-box domain-containing protein n=1 Tax=Urochloa decumbens TaxID=240449 RepID=A0ABC9FGS8_9POAL